ncbi:MAG: Peptide methionine sulfoxide reductase MsrB [Chlamydiae bacterium]|nr:Peptide methionine sulfoxide reductase MsrB [Chlamydiota bacterium]
MKKLILSDNEWKEKLTKEQYRILRKRGTEKPFSGEYHDCHDQGTYVCVACAQPLFTSEYKFDSGTGWPSFWMPISPHAIEIQEDRSLFKRRTEVLCSRCGSHLGHAFADGPPPTNMRYCMNSIALKLLSITAGMVHPPTH